MRCLIWRKVSLILRFTRFRATAFPTFFEAMTPSLFLPNSLGREKTMHNFPTRFFPPSAMTFSNSGRLVSRSVFLKEKFSIYSAPVPLLGMKASERLLHVTLGLVCNHSAWSQRAMPIMRPKLFAREMRRLPVTSGSSPQSDRQAFPAFAPAVCQNASSPNGRASFAEAVRTFSFNITGLKSPFHKSILKNNPAKCKKPCLALTKSDG